jgi:hypothetical protein
MERCVSCAAPVNGWMDLHQSEEAQYKLDGLILVIEGVGRTKSDGHPVLQAFGVISFDNETATYRMRAFNDGRFLESEVKLLDQDRAISWGFACCRRHRVSTAIAVTKSEAEGGRSAWCLRNRLRGNKRGASLPRHPQQLSRPSSKKQLNPRSSLNLPDLQNAAHRGQRVSRWGYTCVVRLAAHS